MRANWLNYSRLKVCRWSHPTERTKSCSLHSYLREPVAGADEFVFEFGRVRSMSDVVDRHKLGLWPHSMQCPGVSTCPQRRLLGFLSYPGKKISPTMPVISSFYGIDIKMYFRDHFPPHFHAFYAEFSAEIAISDSTVLAGALPRRAMALVLEWAEIHRAELLAEWEKAWNGFHPDRIEPLP
jgi:hypothetical protein